MSKLNPTLGIRDTSKNVKDFIKTNNDTLWGIVKSIAPWIIGLYLLDSIVTYLYFPESENGFMLGSIIAGYFYTVLVISWHRVAIHGPENAIMMNPFKPKKNELVFIGMGIALGIASVLVVLLPVVLVVLNPVVGGVVMLLAIILAVYIGFKLCFYFPAKAVNASITFKKSFYLTKGYFWKLLWSYAMASLKYILLMLAFYLVVFGAIVGIAMASGEEELTPALDAFLTFIVALPIALYFSPLLYAVGVTVLSNYYQHAIQNKS